MLVVSDTSPLNYLILIDAVDILQKMYGRIVVPIAVARELDVTGTPPKARSWFANRPAWVEVQTVKIALPAAALDAGELEAIALAKQLNADLLLTDERLATAFAREQEKLKTVGTLGVLLDAALAGLIDLPVILARLQNETNFHVRPLLYQQILDAYKTQKNRQT